MRLHTDLVERFEDLTPHERKNVIAAVHELLATTRDAAAGYEVAAGSVKDESLAELLRGFASERREAAAQLEALLQGFGQGTEEPQRISGEIQRAWIALRAKLGSHDDAGVLSECERFENHALHRYDRALNQKLPVPIADLLLDQKLRVSDARSAFERMRHPW